MTLKPKIYKNPVQNQDFNLDKAWQSERTPESVLMVLKTNLRMIVLVDLGGSKLRNLDSRVYTSHGQSAHVLSCPMFSTR